MKNILFLTQIVPYPPDAGPKIKTWNVLRFLAEKGYQITLVTFVRSFETPHLETLRGLGMEVLPVPIQRRRIADARFLLQSYLTGQPFLIERDNLPAMRKLVGALLAERHYDVVHADQFTMPQFVPLRYKDEPHPIRIFDAHNANWSVIERSKANAPFYQKPFLSVEQQRLKRYEGQIVNHFECTLTVTDIDRQRLAEAAASVAAGADSGASRRIITIPIAVNTREILPVKRPQASLHLLTLGTLHYQPNADGIRWFIQEVFPRIQRDLPGISLTIIGKNPPPDFIQFARQDPKIIVAGYVPDLTPYLEQSALMVIPVRAGGGMRVRILEGFARGMPMVTTTTGLEGIEARPGLDVLVADTPEAFAAEVTRLAQDKALQTQLSVNGRRLAEEKYDWQVVLSRLNQIYHE